MTKQEGLERTGLHHRWPRRPNSRKRGCRGCHDVGKIEVGERKARSPRRGVCQSALQPCARRRQVLMGTLHPWQAHLPVLTGRDAAHVQMVLSFIQNTSTLIRRQYLQQPCDPCWQGGPACLRDRGARGEGHAGLLCHPGWLLLPRPGNSTTPSACTLSLSGKLCASSLVPSKTAPFTERIACQEPSSLLGT